MTLELELEVELKSVRSLAAKLRKEFSDALYAGYPVTLRCTYMNQDQPQTVEGIPSRISNSTLFLRAPDGADYLRPAARTSIPLHKIIEYSRLTSRQPIQLVMF